MAKPVASKPPESLIPDYCHLPVLLRALVAVHLALLLALWSRGDTPGAALKDLMQSCALSLPVLALSALALCVLRRRTLAYPLAAGWQRAWCALIPAAASLLVTEVMSYAAWFHSIFPDLNPFLLACFAALSGACMQHYVEIRSASSARLAGQAQIQALQSRIRPHFLFNSLNTVLAFIRTEPLKAELLVEDLAELFRALMGDVRLLSSLAEELRLCRQYIAIEQLRLGHRLQLQWKLNDIDDRCLQSWQLPSLLIQPLLENAVLHGVEPSEAPVTIVVELSHQQNQLRLSIRNPRHAYARVLPGNGMALDNIRQRLFLIYASRASLETRQTADEFEVNVIIPEVG